jgi:hypothetical protein
MDCIEKKKIVAFTSFQSGSASRVSAITRSVKNGLLLLLQNRMALFLRLLFQIYAKKQKIRQWLVVFYKYIFLTDTI